MPLVHLEMRVTVMLIVYSYLGFQFTPALYHPNIYPDGKVCISILHPAGDDIISGELAHERWSPVQRVESVLISILSLLDDAETSSPANVDAAVMLRKNPDEYRAIVRSNVEVSQAGIPEGFEMPTHESTTMPKVEKEDPDFWADSDDENDTFTFGGSDSGEDLDMDDFSVTDDGSGGGDDTKDAEDEISSFRPLVA